MHLTSYSNQPSKLLSVPIAVALVATMALHAWWDTIAVFLWHDAALTAELFVMLIGLWGFYLYVNKMSRTRELSVAETSIVTLKPMEKSDEVIEE